MKCMARVGRVDKGARAPVAVARETEGRHLEFWQGLDWNADNKAVGGRCRRCPRGCAHAAPRASAVERHSTAHVGDGAAHLKEHAGGAAAAAAWRSPAKRSLNLALARLVASHSQALTVVCSPIPSRSRVIGCSLASTIWTSSTAQTTGARISTPRTTMMKCHSRRYGFALTRPRWPPRLRPAPPWRLDDDISDEFRAVSLFLVSGEPGHSGGHCSKYVLPRAASASAAVKTAAGNIRAKRARSRALASLANLIVFYLEDDYDDDSSRTRASSSSCFRRWCAAPPKAITRAR